MKNQKEINDINGVIVLDKPSGFTSNDCISIIKKTIHPRKIGHTGTLDLNATGVLVCLIGDATKRQEYLMKTGNKIYEAELIIGFATDTEDSTGNIISIDKNINEKKINYDIISEKVNGVIESFIGEYNQIPPMYSAKKIGGKKLLNLAYQGKVVERKPCKVKINSLIILSGEYTTIKMKDEIYNVARFSLKVSCSKGTYIRTLCKDIGEKIGYPSCMGNLRRIENGLFNIEDSVKLEDLKEKFSLSDYSFIKPCYYREKETVVTFGKFDTLHIGHKKIINEVVDNAKKNNLDSVVMIVGNNSDNIVISKEQRISRLKYYGIDEIINFKLDYGYGNLSPEDFVIDVLIKQLKAKIVVVGSDCRFGYKGEGDANILTKICEKYDVKVLIIDKLKIAGTTEDISSTYIINKFKEGAENQIRDLL